MKHPAAEKPAAAAPPEVDAFIPTDTDALFGESVGALWDDDPTDDLADDLAIGSAGDRAGDQQPAPQSQDELLPARPEPSAGPRQAATSAAQRGFSLVQELFPGRVIARVPLVQEALPADDNAVAGDDSGFAAGYHDDSGLEPEQPDD